MRVLIVDDSQVMRQYVSGALRELSNLQVEEAASGIEAFKRLAREDYDAVITDINMPDINGMDLIRFLKDHERYAGCKIVVVTIQTNEKTRAKLLRLGADGFVAKPFEPEVLAAVVAEVLHLAPGADPETPT